MTRLKHISTIEQMEVLIEFSREYLAQAKKVFDSSKAPNSEDLLMVLEQEFSLKSIEATWLYNAIVVAKPLAGQFTSIRVVESAAFSGSLCEGSRRYGGFTYIVVQKEPHSITE